MNAVQHDQAFGRRLLRTLEHADTQALVQHHCGKPTPAARLQRYHAMRDAIEPECSISTARVQRARSASPTPAQS